MMLTRFKKISKYNFTVQLNGNAAIKIVHVHWAWMWKNPSVTGPAFDTWSTDPICRQMFRLIWFFEAANWICRILVKKIADQVKSQYWFVNKLSKKKKRAVLYPHAACWMRLESRALSVSWSLFHSSQAGFTFAHYILCSAYKTGQVEIDFYFLSNRKK